MLQVLKTRSSSVLVCVSECSFNFQFCFSSYAQLPIADISRHHPLMILMRSLENAVSECLFTTKRYINPPLSYLTLSVNLRLVATLTNCTNCAVYSVRASSFIFCQPGYKRVSLDYSFPTNRIDFSTFVSFKRTVERIGISSF